MGKVKIVGRVVIVTGPVSTGKSSLCRKMVEQYHKGTCRVVQFQRANPSNSAMLENMLKATNKIQEGIQSESFVVIRTQNMTYESLVSLIVSIRVMGYKDEITVIKMNLPEELHIDFWRRNRKPSKVSLKKLKNERAMFQKIMEKDGFEDAKATSVEINNPENIIFEF